MHKILLLVAFVIVGAGPEAPMDTGSLIRELRWRHIGPFRGGRATAVAGVRSQPSIFYMGACGGGVWKTVDAGLNWTPVTDKFLRSGSVGALAVAESDPNVVYAGMGESPIRGNVSHGDGVYKSMDAGKTWKHTGLENTRHLARLRVHPRNPDLVYAAALGHVFGPNAERGVYRSRDGGKTWELILHRSPKAGAIDLILDPTNPNVIYAGFWEVFRTPYSLESGGPGSGLFKSTDAGDTWTELTRNPGLPKGMIGKVGITVSPVNPERVWAIVESEEGGLFRSDDGGDTWTRVSADRNLRQRAWYYSRVYADPKAVDTVYVLNVGFHRSIDGGSTFSRIRVPHGDNHDLWIHPDDPQRMIESNDGGAGVTTDGGRNWTELDQPTAQFYRVALDNDFPYHVFGAQQDNSTVAIASRTGGFGIDTDDWHDVGGGESGWIAPDPRDSNIVYAGSYGGYLSRYDHRTREERDITVWPDNPIGSGAKDHKYRFQWNAPLVFSPHDPRTLYAAGNVLFKTNNEGQTWTPISPDLTRNDKSRQGASGGPITRDNTGVEVYCTVFTVMESPVQAGLIWAGSDDGLVHVTRDGGKSWQNVTPKKMPEWIQINSIETSPHDAGTAYFAGTMYKSDDFRPYLYRTADHGKSWKKITRGIPDNAFTRVIREDPHRRGLLYAGTETGVYVSFNDGDDWMPLQLNLPVVPITDLAVHKRDRDLVAATQGRSFWILDDLPVLHQMKDSLAREEAFLFQPEDPYRTQGGGAFFSSSSTVGQNPPAGAVVYFSLKSMPKSATLEFLDESGVLIRKLRMGSAPSTASSPTSGPPGPAATAGPTDTFSAKPGLNRFAWDLRYPDATRVPGMILWGGELRGPRVAPGAYQVRLTAGEKTMTQPFAVKRDPRMSTTTEDFIKQRDLLLKIRDQLTEMHDAILQIREIRTQVQDVASKAAKHPNGKPVTGAAAKLRTSLTAIEEELYQTKLQSSQDVLNYPVKLNNRLASLAATVASADTAPTDQSAALHKELTALITAQLSRFRQVVDTDVSAFNRLVRDQEIPAVVIGKEATDR